MWVRDDVLYTFRKWNDDEALDCFEENGIDELYDSYKPITTPLSDIDYFKRGGEIYREQKISGGDGGGSTIGGAILGGLIAGGAGAIIGSRKGTNEIKSETITHDQRYTILVIKGRPIKYKLSACGDMYEVFNKLIPQKEFSIVQEFKRQSILNQQSKTISSIAEQIRDIANLRDEGILTEEEFNTKKKELLSKM